jgi:hypothetical protein
MQALISIVQCGFLAPKCKARALAAMQRKIENAGLPALFFVARVGQVFIAGAIDPANGKTLRSLPPTFVSLTLSTPHPHAFPPSILLALTRSFGDI